MFSYVEDVLEMDRISADDHEAQYLAEFRTFLEGVEADVYAAQEGDMNPALKFLIGVLNGRIQSIDGLRPSARG